MNPTEPRPTLDCLVERNCTREPAEAKLSRAGESSQGTFHRVLPRARGNLLLGGLAVLWLSLATPGQFAAQAQGTSEAEQIREELRQLKLDYQKRISGLEERLRRLESEGASPRTNAVPVVIPSVTPSPIPPSVSVGQDASVVSNALQFAKEQFKPQTATREGALAEGPVRERLETVLQDFIDFNGYFRAGYGRDNKGGPQVAFQAPGALAKYRLGNEAETYGELTLGKNFYVPDLFRLDSHERPNGTPSGPIARVQTTISMYNPYQDLLSSDETTFGLPEAFVSIGNVVGSQPSMKFWAGSRYYRRQDIHILDFFYNNMSGAGGGVEDIQLPFGKLAVAWIGAASTSGFSDVPVPDPDNEAGFSKANWDLRLYDVPVPFGKGEFGLVYARSDSGLDAEGRSADDSDGFSANFVHTAAKFISPDGVNKVSLQFGTGSGKTFTSGFETYSLPEGFFIRPDSDNSWRFRATEHFTAQVSEHFSIGPALVYQVTDYGDYGGVVQWGSAGVRPIFHLNKYLSFACEAGGDWVEDSDAGTSDFLWKVTLAPQISLGNSFYSRPVIRGFITYAHWGDDFRGQVGGNDYHDDNDGLTYGVQMETWW